MPGRLFDLPTKKRNIGDLLATFLSLSFSLSLTYSLSLFTALSSILSALTISITSVS